MYKKRTEHYEIGDAGCCKWKIGQNTTSIWIYETMRKKLGLFRDFRFFVCFSPSCRSRLDFPIYRFVIDSIWFIPSKTHPARLQCVWLDFILIFRKVVTIVYVLKLKYHLILNPKRPEKQKKKRKYGGCKTSHIFIWHRSLPLMDSHLFILAK